MVAAGEGEYVDEVAPVSRVPALQAPLPVADEYHWYKKEGVPPDS
jgi:hypothetical protein